MADALPPIDSSLLPTAVRNAGPKAEKLYSTALSFEQMLTQQLAQSLTSTLQKPSDDADDSGDSDSSGSDASTSMLQQMLPNALAQGMTQAGGLGLADQLYEALGGSGASASTPKAGT
jgi:Rod binding domain-containing protein